MKADVAARRMESLAKIVLKAKLRAARHVNRIVSGEDAESKEAWRDVSVRTVAALKVHSGTMAAERAAQETRANVLGVVVMVPQMQSREEWEAVAKTPERLVIEAPAEPGTDDATD